MLTQSPIGRLLPRKATARVVEALADTRVVLVNGARQRGKSTLAAQVGADRGAELQRTCSARTKRA
jgi:predicted AAA+ superfamily ATPase